MREMREKESYTIREMCAVFGVSESGYHAWLDRGQSARVIENAKLVGQIEEINADRHTSCYGSPRMTRALLAGGASCSENMPHGPSSFALTANQLPNITFIYVYFKYNGSF